MCFSLYVSLPCVRRLESGFTEEAVVAVTEEAVWEAAVMEEAVWEVAVTEEAVWEAAVTEEAVWEAVVTEEAVWEVVVTEEAVPMDTVDSVEVATSGWEGAEAVATDGGPAIGGGRGLSTRGQFLASRMRNARLEPATRATALSK